MGIMIENNKNGEVTLKATKFLITDKDMDIIDNNLQDIVNEFIQKVVKDKDLTLSQYIIKKQNDEKQQLISFLKDKIELCNRDLKEFKKNASAYFNLISIAETIKNTCQEVLDFVNKGGKDE